MLLRMQIPFITLFLLAGVYQDNSACADYSLGFKWKRQTDYNRGTSRKKPTLGNPNSDSEGNGVWLYESTKERGSPLESEKPWYQLPTDRNRWLVLINAGGGGWLSPYSEYCHIDNRELVSYGVSEDPRSKPNPIVRGLNPLAENATIDIEGEVAIPTRDVEFVLAKWDASQEKFQELIKSNDSDLLLAIQLENVRIEPGDQLIYSMRKRELIQTKRHAWIRLRDDITITLKSLDPN